MWNVESFNKYRKGAVEVDSAKVGLETQKLLYMSAALDVAEKIAGATQATKDVYETITGESLPEKKGSGSGS